MKNNKGADTMLNKAKDFLTVYNDLLFIDKNTFKKDLAYGEKLELINRYLKVSTAMALMYHHERKTPKSCAKYSNSFNFFLENLSNKEKDDNKKDLNNIKDNFKYVLYGGVPSEALINIIKSN